MNSLIFVVLVFGLTISVSSVENDLFQVNQLETHDVFDPLNHFDFSPLNRGYFLDSNIIGTPSPKPIELEYLNPDKYPIDFNYQDFIGYDNSDYNSEKNPEVKESRPDPIEEPKSVEKEKKSDDDFDKKILNVKPIEVESIEKVVKEKSIEKEGLKNNENKKEDTSLEESKEVKKESVETSKTSMNETPLESASENNQKSDKNKRKKRSETFIQERLDDFKSIGQNPTEIIPHLKSLRDQVQSVIDLKIIARLKEVIKNYKGYNSDLKKISNDIESSLYKLKDAIDWLQLRLDFVPEPFVRKEWKSYQNDLIQTKDFYTRILNLISDLKQYEQDHSKIDSILDKFNQEIKSEAVSVDAKNEKITNDRVQLVYKKILKLISFYKFVGFAHVSTILLPYYLALSGMPLYPETLLF